MHAVHLVLIYIVFVQSQSHVQLFATLWPVVHQAPLSSTVSWSLLQFMSIESVMLSNHLILCHLLLLLLSIFPSLRILVSKLILCIRWPKYWSFSFGTILPMDIQGWFPLGWTGLISLLSKGLLRNNLKASGLQCSGLFMTQISHMYMTPGKTIAVTIWTFIGKVMSLLLNMVPRFVIAFLPRGKHLLISWLQSPSPVILETNKRKDLWLLPRFPYLPWNDGTGCHGLRFLNAEFQARFLILLFDAH